MKKVFLDDLPRGGLNRGNRINWFESVGYEVRFIYDDIEGYITIINYTDNRLYIQYLNNKILDITPDHFRECKIGKLLGKITKEFKIKIGTRFKDEKRDIIITDKEYRLDGKNEQNRKWYKYTCNVCGWSEGWIEESNLSKGIGCSCCRGLSLVEGINDISTVAPWMIKYFQGGYDEAKLYTKHGGGNSDNPQGYIYPVCPDCGRIKNKKISISKIYSRHSIGCSCGDGLKYPNKFAFKMLESLNVEFISEYSPPWAKSKSYDFYFKLNNKEYILEMDGAFHSKDNNMNGQTAEESKLIDDYKDRLAKEQNIEIIRIDCDYGSNDRFKYIKQNILNNKMLNKLFDLNIVNWSAYNKFACSNLVKIACEYKKNNMDITTTDIGEILGVCSSTISRWLKQGNGIWCNYDPKEEMRKNSSRNGKRLNKPLEIFKDNVSLGKFESISDLSRQSERLFGVKLLETAISEVCNNKKSKYKDFTFKFTNTISIHLHNENLVQAI